MRICPVCEHTYTDEVDFCPRDATPLPAPLNATQFNVSAGLSRRYRIVRQLGVGGMGTVFLAEQIAVGNRPVALKVLHCKLLEDPDFLQRFQDEASSTGRIRHPNVVTVYECGQMDDGSPYIAMEYLDGETLRQTLKRRGSLPLLEAVEILQQAARGLNAAHKLGIVHRDLKPDNILLTHDEEGQVVVKIVDFGIAKMRESTSHTMTGLAVGTPAYMSVEQASGMRSDELDGRSDVYSLGVVAYEMITGRVPFQADTPLAYLKKHLIEPPAPITVTRPDLHISPQMDQAVMKALQKERTDRYPTAPDFARAVANSVATKSTDIAKTEFAIPDVGRSALEAPRSVPLTSVSQSALLTPASMGEPLSQPPAAIRTVTLARRNSRSFGIMAAAVILVGSAGAAWYVLSTRTATSPRISVPPVQSTPNPQLIGTPAHPGQPPRTKSTTEQDLTHKVAAAIAHGDLLYRQGRYDEAIAEYKRALAFVPTSVTLPLKLRHAASAKEAEQRVGMSSPPGRAPSPTHPRSTAELVDLLKSYVPASRVADFAQRDGIDFEPTPASEKELRQAGADDELIGALRDLAPEPSTSETATQAGPDLDRAQELIKSGQFSQALPLIQRSAAGGNPNGQRLMGDAYAQGWGVTKDYLHARNWYEKAAAGGNTLAMVRIGNMFEKGWGGPQDYLRARQWFEKSAGAGNALAMVRIGDLYERGWGQPKDYTEARFWYEKSAAKRNALAMLRLGNLYERGWGVQRDLKRARQWFQSSAAAGNVNARTRLEELPN